LVAGSEVDLIFLEGTLEGLTSQLCINNGEMLQVANEAETYFQRLYSIKGKNIPLKLDDNKARTMYLNFHGGGKFKNVTKTKGVIEIPNVALNFVGCIHPETMIKFLNMDDKNHDGLLERYVIKFKLKIYRDLLQS
jgi:hypothetical protein